MPIVEVPFKYLSTCLTAFKYAVHGALTYLAHKLVASLSLFLAFNSYKVYPKSAVAPYIIDIQLTFKSMYHLSPISIMQI